MSDIRAALEYAVELSEPLTYEHESLPGYFLSDKKLIPILLPKPDPIGTKTLEGLCELVKAEIAKYKVMYVQVMSPTEVRVITNTRSDESRLCLFTATAELPRLAFETYMDTESALIMLKARYMATPERDALIGLLGTIREEKVKTTEDDGISQTVTARMGIAQVGNVRINPIQTLKPYRTFLEVEQPSCEYLIRMKDGPEIAIFEADGGFWKLEAVASIAKYLDDQLKDIEGVRVIR